jgi:hypothetical protein
MADMQCLLARLERGALERQRSQVNARAARPRAFV